MKMSKANVSVLTLSLIGIMLLLIDIFTVRNGKRGFNMAHLKSGLTEPIESKNEIDRKLNEISNSIISLSTRLSNIEQSISKLDGSFEKKIIYPSRPKSTEMESSDTKENIFEHIHHKNNKHNQHRHRNASRKNFNGSYNNNFAHNGSEARFVSSSMSNKNNHKYDDKDIPDNFNLGFESKVNTSNQNIQHNMKKDNAFDIESENPAPIVSRAIIKKIRVSFEPINKPHKDLLSGSRPSFYPLNMNEIFPDLTHEDPIVEVKKFNDLDSFRNFGNNLVNHNSLDNDGATETNYYKMSDIINPTHDSHSNSTEKSTKSLPEPIPEFDRIGEVKESIDLFENAPTSKSIVRSGLSDSPISPAADSTSKLKISKNAVESDIRDLESKKQDAAAKQESFCENFEDPKKAFKDGKCIFKKPMQSDMPIKNEKDLMEKSKLSNEMFDQLEATIKDLEEKLKETKKVEDKLADKKTEINKPLEFDNVKQDELRNLNENTIREIEELQKEFKNTENEIFKSTQIKVESDDLIQKPTKIQPVS